jgi:hypothetical protein
MRFWLSESNYNNPLGEPTYRRRIPENRAIALFDNFELAARRTFHRFGGVASILTPELWPIPGVDADCSGERGMLRPSGPWLFRFPALNLCDFASLADGAKSALREIFLRLFCVLLRLVLRKSLRNRGAD